MTSAPNAEGHPVVLVIDDPRRRRLLEGAPPDTTFFSYLEAEDPARAESVLDRLKPEVVVIDAHLPQERGLALCAAIRRRPGFEALPVILVVNPGDAATAQRAYEAGAFAVEGAPLAWPMFGHRLRHVLRLGQTLEAARRKATGLEKAQRIARLMNWSWDPERRDFHCSVELMHFLGLKPGDLPTFDSYLERVHSDDRAALKDAFLDAVYNKRAYSLEYRLRTGGGAFATVFDTAEAVLDEYGRSLELIGSVLDVTEWRGTEERLRSLTHFDAATGLPNRVLFLDRLGQALAQAKRSKWQVALLILDLVGFKDLNLTLGHAAGDRLLKEVGRRLGECIRTNDTVARLGGNEFGMILVGIKTAESASLVAQKALKALQQPIALEGRDAFTSCCIGIAVYPGDGDAGDSLLRSAETAMYRAKETARDTVQFYTPGMNARVAERLEVETGLRGALARGQFDLLYQAMVEPQAGRITGMEALLRWNHAERGTLAPEQFIHVLESTGLIVPVGEWVLRSACLQSQAFLSAGLPPLRTAVNLSMRQFREQSLVETVSRVLLESGIPPDSLELELTESLLMEDTEEAIAKLNRIRDLGVRLSIDDFGTGFSSLSYLSRFPIDTLKIDKSFIRNIAFQPGDIAIAKSIIALARSLNLRVVVEGVENEAQLRFFREHLCDEIQGFYCAAPMPGPEFARLVREGLPIRLPG
jgi:diguanylate cyclase (GGDEF)-like protein